MYYQKALCKLLRKKSNESPYNAVKPANSKDKQPKKKSPTAQQGDFCLGGNQQLPNWSEGRLNSREFMPDTISLAKYPWLGLSLEDSLLLPFS